MISGESRFSLFARLRRSADALTVESWDGLESEERSHVAARDRCDIDDWYRLCNLVRVPSCGGSDCVGHHFVGGPIVGIRPEVT